MLSRSRKADIMRSLALLALLGFGSQYPIPEWHQCRKLHPEVAGSSQPRPQTSSHSEATAVYSSNPEAPASRKTPASPEAGHRPSATGSPPCHGSSATSEESSGHDHESCPVCQGYLLLGFIDFQQPGPALLTLEEISTDTISLSTSTSYSHTRICEILARPPPYLS